MEPFERIYDADYDAGDSDSVRGSDSSDDGHEDFDSEMQRELDRRVGIENKEKESLTSRECQQAESGSDKEAGPSGKVGSSHVSKNTHTADDANAEALYDPDEDEDNERWAQKQRQINIYPGTKGQTVPLPNSDAVLNCPGCMTVLCRDCQMHDTVVGQYRAMFVLNCKVDATTEVPGPLVYSDKRRKRRRGDSKQNPLDEDGMVFHPFYCTFCNTRVGVVDNDEVYHFLQEVLPRFGTELCELRVCE